MTTREEILERVEPYSEDAQQILNEYINEIESEVNKAKDHLCLISSIWDLHKAKEAFDTLEQLSKDLY